MLMKQCETCGETFVKTTKLSAMQWLDRRCCSKTCVMVARGKAALVARGDIRTAFAGQIKKTTRCWPWQGPKNGNGYGEFIYDKKRYRAPAFALELDGRPVPKGMQACHHCDNPICVRPSHLYVGTPKNNTDDIWRRKRHPNYGVEHWAAKLTPENVLEMRRQRLRGWSFAVIADIFGVTRNAAKYAVLGKTWNYSVPSNADDLARLKQVKTTFTMRS